MAMPTEDVAKEADYGRLKQGEGGGGEGGEGVRTEIAGQKREGFLHSSLSRSGKHFTVRVH